MDRRQEIERMIGQLQAISAADSTPTIYHTAHAAADLLRTVGREHFAAQDDLRRYKEAAMSASGSFSMTGTPIGTRIGTNTGHGHVWKRPDGAVAKCGGPALCTECARDLASLRNVTPYVAELSEVPAATTGRHDVSVAAAVQFMSERCSCTAEGQGDGTCRFCATRAVINGLNAERQNLRLRLGSKPSSTLARRRRMATSTTLVSEAKFMSQTCEAM